MLKYEVTERMELARELGAHVVANYSRYMDEHGISDTDKEHAIAAEYSRLYRLQDSVYAATSLQEVNDIISEFQKADKQIIAASLVK